MARIYSAFINDNRREECDCERFVVEMMGCLHCRKCALLSQEVYAFGDVLTTEIRTIAAQGGYPWLYELLLLVNKGEVARWNEAKELYKPMMLSDPSFEGKLDVVDEKVALLALLELFFHRPTTDRCLRFEDISSCCQIEMNRVGEMLSF